MGKSGRNPQLVGAFSTLQAAIAWIEENAVSGATYRMQWQHGGGFVHVYKFQ